MSVPIDEMETWYVCVAGHVTRPSDPNRGCPRYQCILDIKSLSDIPAALAVCVLWKSPTHGFTDTRALEAELAELLKALQAFEPRKD